MKKALIFGIFAALLAGGTLAMSKDKKGADVEMTLVGVEYKGSKLWLPGTIVAHEGDTVRLKLINKIPGEGTTHGFAIDRFGIKTVVAQGETETVEFKADKEGIFPFYCQLHPAHVGGQVVVLD